MNPVEQAQAERLVAAADRLDAAIAHATDDFWRHADAIKVSPALAGELTRFLRETAEDMAGSVGSANRLASLILGGDS